MKAIFDTATNRLIVNGRRSRIRRQWLVKIDATTTQGAKPWRWSAKVARMWQKKYPGTFVSAANTTQRILAVKSKKQSALAGRWGNEYDTRTV